MIEKPSPTASPPTAVREGVREFVCRAEGLIPSDVRERSSLLAWHTPTSEIVRYDDGFRPFHSAVALGPRALTRRLGTSIARTSRALCKHIDLEPTRSFRV